MSRRYFGTDGIRGRVGAVPMTPDFVLKLGWAAGRVLVNDGHPVVLIGKDTRISGYMLESALQAGLSAAGVNIGAARVATHPDRTATQNFDLWISDVRVLNKVMKEIERVKGVLSVERIRA